jgi:phosphoglycerate dehydrogenase-like enzyme
MPAKPDKEKLRVHIKNNRASPDTFPNTAEGERVFSITKARFDAVARKHPRVARRLDVTIDWDTDNFERDMKDADVLIAWDLPTKDLARKAPKLKWIHCIGAGVEHLMPLDWLPPGVHLVNSKGVHAAKSGEFGLMAVMMLNCAMPALVRRQQSKEFDPIYATPLAGKTLAVIGVGNIGGAVARHAKRMGMRVLGVRRHGKPARGVDRMYAPGQIDQVLPQADVVFVSTPLTPETRHLLDRRRLNLMKRGAGLINVGREPVVDYRALADALRDGRIGGAILDVFEPEPLPRDSYLWDVPNLIITPHVSSDDGVSYVSLTLELFFDNLARHFAGRRLRNRVDRKLGY